MIRRPRRASPTRLRSLAAAAGLAAAVILGPAAPGSAGAAIEAGWWMTPAPVAPDAPPDGLVIQGGATGDVAYAAVRFALPPGELPESLLLRVAPDTASTPNTTLVLCALTEPFTPGEGGPMADAPSYDCDQSVEAEPSADGTSYTFEVADLVADDALAVAIRPTAFTDRVVLSAPGAYSLVAASPVLPPTLDPPPTPTAPPPGTVDLPPSEVPVGSAPSFPPVDAPAPQAEEPPVVEEEPPLAAAPAAQQGEVDEGSWLRTLLVLGLVSVAAGLWSAAGAESEDEVTASAAPA